MDNIKRKRRKKGRPSKVHSQPTGTVANEQQQEHSRIFSDDIEIEILLRLPVKSLLRFMCVCKNWKTLISSHPLRNLHREKHISSPPLIISFYNSCYLNDYDSEEDQAYTYLITSDLGGNFIEKIIVPIPLKQFYMHPPAYQAKLLCFHNSAENDTYLYNPSIRRSYLLTNPSSFSSPEFQLHYEAELGYFPSKDEYIMVHLVKANDKLVCEVLNNIFISDDNFKLHYNQWRSFIDDTIVLCYVKGDGIFVGGSFFWKAVVENPSENIILLFDIEEGCFSTFGIPQECILDYASLLELNGELYLSNYPETPATLTLWKLSADKLWTLYWVFNFDRLFGFPRGFDVDKSFRSEMFIYRLKYLKGYDEQPCDNQVSAKMGKLRQGGWLIEIPVFTFAATHTNLFTL